MGWLIALGVMAAIVLIVLLVVYLPVGIRATYDSQGLKTWYTVFSVPVWSFDLTEDEKSGISLNKILTSAGKGGSKPQPESVQQKPRTADKLSQFWEDVKLLLRFYWGVLDYVKLKRLQLRFVLAGDDPMDLAMHYGEVCAAVGGVIAILENIITVGRRDIIVDCDFTANKTQLTAKLDFTVPLGKVVWYLIKYVFSLVKDSNN